MANEIRRYQNYIGGRVTSAITSGGTTLTSDGLASMQTVGSSEHIVVVMDPDGAAGEPEEVWVTAHTATQTTATVVRGKNGTTARAHALDIPWVHTAVNTDYPGNTDQGASTYGPVSGVCFVATYAGASTVSGSSASFADVDATNAKWTFLGPPSGKVILHFSALMGGTATGNLVLGVHDGSADVAASAEVMAGNLNYRHHYEYLVTGLTPGTSYTYKLRYKSDNAGQTVSIFRGDTNGGWHLRAEAVNY